MPGQVYGDYESYVIEELAHPGVILAVITIHVYDEGRTVSFGSGRTREVWMDTPILIQYVYVSGV